MRQKHVIIIALIGPDGSRMYTDGQAATLF